MSCVDVGGYPDGDQLITLASRESLYLVEEQEVVRIFVHVCVLGCVLVFMVAVLAMYYSLAVQPILKWADGQDYTVLYYNT